MNLSMSSDCLKKIGSELDPQDDSNAENIDD